MTLNGYDCAETGAVSAHHVGLPGSEIGCVIVTEQVVVVLGWVIG
jgi:alanine-alpha-ketoisovalerate/valine-pyruvate aminotransferase